MIPNLHPYPQHKESDGSTPTALRPPAQHPALWVHGLQVIGFVEVAGAATQRPVRPLVLAAPARRHDVFDFKGEIEDGLRGAAVFATMPGSLRHRWVAGIHYLKSAETDETNELAANPPGEGLPWPPFRVEAPIRRPPGVALREQSRAEGSNPFRIGIGIGQQTFRSIQRDCYHTPVWQAFAPSRLRC